VAGASVIAERLKQYGGLVAFSHTIFAMPFAASAVILALAQPHVPLTPWRVLAMIVCMVTARTSAMAFNRWADRDVDAKNPRTKSRHVPAGLVSAREALALAILSGAAFVACAWTLGTWPGALSVPVLVVLLGYSWAKRFTWAAHVWLGVALALAPGGAWIACGAAPSAGILWLMAAVVTWLLGFDVLYSLQDREFDAKSGLHSIPARFGLNGALVISALAHVVTVAALAAVGVSLDRGKPFFFGVALVAAILIWEHALVGKGNLAKIDKAFFDLNAYVSIAFLGCVSLDAWLR
jgi:4-hydroxybenzoate polyprenyltransferase